MTTADPPDPTPGQPARATEVQIWCVEGSVPAQPRRVPGVRHAIEGLLTRYGASALTVGRVGLAVTEATSNVVLHAYPGRHVPGCLRYEADIEDGDLEIVISDDGQGLRDDHKSDGLGLGLQIIAAVSDDFAIKARPHGVELWMRFVLES